LKKERERGDMAFGFFLKREKGEREKKTRR